MEHLSFTHLQVFPNLKEDILNVLVTNQFLVAIEDHGMKINKYIWKSMATVG